MKEFNVDEQSFDDGNVSDVLDTEEKALNKSQIKSEIIDWIDVLTISVIAVVFIFTFLFRIVTIDGDSMNDTLFHGEKVIISNLFYEPKYGDIVVVSRNTNNSVETDEYSSPIIKRVIAVAGQTVDIDYGAGIVYVDGIPLEEDYTRTLTTLKHDYEIDFPAYVPDNCIFVMGDNRNNSLDSRSSFIGKDGMIDTRYVMGKAVYRIYPFSRFGGLYE